MWRPPVTIPRTGTTTEMYRASLITSLIAFVLFVYGQARGVDPLSFFDGNRIAQSSSKSSSYHK